jgi:hypothetical protein
MREILIAIAMGVLLYMSGCSSVPSLYSELEAWKGQSIGLVIEHYGKPSQISYKAKSTEYRWLNHVHDMKSGRDFYCAIIVTTGADDKVVGWEYAGDRQAGCI